MLIHTPFYCCGWYLLLSGMTGKQFFPTQEKPQGLSTRNLYKQNTFEATTFQWLLWNLCIVSQFPILILEEKPGAKQGLLSRGICLLTDLFKLSFLRAAIFIAYAFAFLYIQLLFPNFNPLVCLHCIPSCAGQRFHFYVQQKWQGNGVCVISKRRLFFSTHSWWKPWSFSNTTESPECHTLLTESSGKVQSWSKGWTTSPVQQTAPVQQAEASLPADFVEGHLLDIVSPSSFVKAPEFVPQDKTEKEACVTH